MPDLHPSSWLARLVRAIAPPVPRNLASEAQEYQRFAEASRLRRPIRASEPL